MRNSKVLFLQLAVLYSIIILVFFFPVFSSSASANTNQRKVTVPLAKTGPPIPPNLSSYVEGVPIKIEIPAVGINLNVIKGDYTNNSWTLTDDKAQYASMTSLINNKGGNTLIYGHDIPSVLYPTQNLKIGDTLYVYTDNNHIFEYSYTGSDLVYPSDTSVFSYKGSPRVTLLTCNGWFDRYRRLMYFKFLRID